MESYWTNFPEFSSLEFYEDWKGRYPERRLFSVSEYSLFLQGHELRYIDGSFAKKGYNHLKGILLKKGEGNGKHKRVKNPNLKKGLFAPENIEVFTEKFRYVILKDEKTEDIVKIVVNNSIGEMLYSENVGTPITLLFQKTSGGGWLTPYFYQYNIDVNEESSPIQEREKIRYKTYQFYHKVFQRDSHRCLKCGCKDQNILEIHHRNYNNFSTEEEALKIMHVICRPCHLQITKEQIRASQFEGSNLKKWIN